MEFTLKEHSHNLTITMSHVTLMLNKTIAILAYTCVGTNTVSINALKLIGAVSIKPIIVIRLNNCGKGNKPANMIYVSDSNFTNILFIGEDVAAFAILVESTQFWACFSIISITHSMFYKITANLLLATRLKKGTAEVWKPRTLVKIQSTYFDLININDTVIHLTSIDLLLEGPVLFTNIKTGIMLHVINSHVRMRDYTEISLGVGDYCVGASYIVLKENTLFNITGNIFIYKFFYATSHLNQLYFEGSKLWCTLQYDRENHSTTV